MSKRNANLFSRTVFTALVVCGSLAVNATESFGQGFSIFEPPSEDKAPVVSSREAFTNPKVVLPKSQFGSFDTPKAEVAPKLEGSKAVGTYAHDGPGMFKQSPDQVAVEHGKLKPFVANTLRPQQRPQPDSSDLKEVTPPPVVVGDFQESARRLPAQPQVVEQQNQNAPRVAQVAFQDGGFEPQSPASSNRFSLGASSGGDRFNVGANQSQQAGGASSRGQAATQSQPTDQNQRLLQPQAPTPGAFQPQIRKPLQPSGGSAARAGTTNQRLGQAGGTAPLGMQQRQTQPMQSRPNPGRNNRSPRVASSNLSSPVAAPAKPKSQPASAKELLTQWSTLDTEKKLPGKKMKLHDFLARPINGSRKDAINQYWVTFADMARNRLAVEHAQWLDSIGNPRQQAEVAILKAAQQSAQNRVMQSEIQLAKSQLLLGDYLPNLRYKNGQIIPVLPANTPWVGKMSTRLKEYQRKGIVPAQFSGIDNYLVKAKQLIANEADAVVASGKAAEQAKSALLSGQTSIANLLEAMRIKERNEEEFLAAVLGYNRAITDYVLSVRQDIYQPKRLASVLIGRQATQPTLAKAEKPEEDLEPASQLSDEPKLKQVSATRKIGNPAKLPGKSAYQEDDSESVDMESGDDSQASSIMNPSAIETTKTNPRQAPFEFGPTAETAAASNFNPDALKEELPMRQVKESETSSGYRDDGQRARIGQSGRVSSLGGENSSGAMNTRQFGNGIGGSSSQLGVSRPAAQRSTASPIGNPAVVRPQQNAGSRGAFPGAQPSVPAAETVPKIPTTGSPFIDSTASSPTTGANIGNRFGTDGGAGSGTFTPNPIKPAATASGVGTPGFSTRR